MSIIILEGPDGGGKTTLAYELEKHGYIYRHEGPPPNDCNLIEHYSYILGESIKSKSNIVHDRLFLGERIYGKICRGVDRLGEHGEKTFMEALKRNNILMLICMPRYEICKVNYCEKIKESDDYLKSREKFIRVYNAYASWLLFNPEILVYDYENFSVEDVLEKVEVLNGITNKRR